MKKFLFCVSCAFALSQPARAAFHLGLSGSQKSSTWLTERENSYEGKGSISVDLSSYFRLSLPGRRSFQNTKGTNPLTIRIR